MKILGLYLALHTGWAICEYGEITDSGVWDFSKVRGKGKHNGHVFVGLLYEIDLVFTEFLYGKPSIDVDHVCYERSHFRGGPATRIGVGLTSHVLSYCADNGFAVSDVHTTTLKKWATGDGRASKANMMRAATERTGKVYESDDESDAVLIALYCWDNAKGKQNESITRISRQENRNHA